MSRQVYETQIWKVLSVRIHPKRTRLKIQDCVCSGQSSTGLSLLCSVSFFFILKIRARVEKEAGDEPLMPYPSFLSVSSVLVLGVWTS